GAVEVVAEGSSEALKRLEAACREGPRMSRVRRVERAMESIPAASFQTFEIR
ncbi:MAG: acylphosphatase, partial [Planctomycetes bacterium]|nr:acylphosphatase [Planctomycetota bacterium]